MFMDYIKLNAIGTVMIGFISLLAGLMALIYYFLIIAKMEFLGVFIIAIIYIDLILLVLCTLRGI